MLFRDETVSIGPSASQFTTSTTYQRLTKVEADLDNERKRNEKLEGEIESLRKLSQHLQTKMLSPNKK